MTGEAPKIQLLVVQPTPFCNIDCRYCYLPDRASKAAMTPETLSNLFKRVFGSGWARDWLSVIWHAGEPMVMPVGFYRDAFRAIDRLKPDGLLVTHSFQTNGTLIDQDWCEFLRREHVNIGVSIDGPRHFHDLNRRTRSGRGTFDKTIAGIRQLRRHGVDFHVISVLTAASMAAPKEMFEFYLAEGIERVCFNVEESEGDHVSQSLGREEAGDAYYRFLSEFWRLSAANPGRLVFIREIEHALKMILRPKESAFYNELVEPFAVTSVDWSGNVATFSPELLGLKNAAYGDFIIGNVNRQSFAEMAASPVLAAMKRDVDAGVALCREHCEYFSVCGGGEPVNKLAENGSFVSSETAYCRVHKMRGMDLVLDAIERVSMPELPEVPPALRNEQLRKAIGLPAAE